MRELPAYLRARRDRRGARQLAPSGRRRLEGAGPAAGSRTTAATRCSSATRCTSRSTTRPRGTGPTARTRSSTARRSSAGRRYFEELGVEAISWGALILRKRPEGRNWFFSYTSATDRITGASDQVLRLFDAQDYLAVTSAEDMLGDAFTVPDDHRVEQTIRLRDGGELIERNVLRLDTGLASRSRSTPRPSACCRCSTASGRSATCSPRPRRSPARHRRRSSGAPFPSCAGWSSSASCSPRSEVSP